MRQIFIHLYKSALSSVTYDDVLNDWLLFETSFSEKWGQGERDASFRASTFQSWASTMKLAVEKRLLNVIFQVVHTQMSLSYERFVDWVVTTGLVPIYKDKENTKLMKELEQLFHDRIPKEARAERSLTGMTHGLLSELSVVVKALTSKYIPDYSEVVIEQRGSKLVGTYKNKRLDILVLSRPILCDGQVIFDSPVQRLSCSVMACHRTQEHAKLCQLLHTSPIKGITTDSGNTLYSELMVKLDESSQKNDPKKELLNLLVKLAENKTVSGVTDVVEDFITDVSQNIVDKSKLFNEPGSSSETIKRGLKKHVSSSVFKCLTNQINKQFETISDLQKEKRLFVKKINLLEERLTSLEQPDAPPHSGCIITGDTFSSLQLLERTGDLGRNFFQVAKGEHVNNSFFSQYVPPIADIRQELTLLWETEVFQTYKLTPVVDNQGQRLYVKYSQDTISLLVGPFTYGCAGLHSVNLITAPHSALSLQDIADEIFRDSRLAVYILDIGRKYYTPLQNGTEETVNWGFAPKPQAGVSQL